MSFNTCRQGTGFRTAHHPAVTVELSECLRQPISYCRACKSSALYVYFISWLRGHNIYLRVEARAVVDSVHFLAGLRVERDTKLKRMHKVKAASRRLGVDGRRVGFNGSKCSKLMMGVPAVREARKKRRADLVHSA